MVFGLALALLTSVFWALGNVYIQRTGRLIGEGSALLWAMVVGAVLAGTASAIFEGEVGLGPRLLARLDRGACAWLALAVIAGLVAYVALFWSLARAPLSIAIPFVSSWSLVAAVFSIGLLGESLRGGEVLGGALVLTGVVLVGRSAGRPAGRPEREQALATQPPGHAGHGASSRPSGRGPLVAAAVSGLAFGVMVPAMGQVAEVAGAFGTTALVYAGAVLLGWPLARLAGLAVSPPPRGTLGLVLLTGAFETAGFVTLTLARRHAAMTVVGPLASLAATLTVLYGWLVLRERPGRLAGVGAALACAGVVALALR